MAEKRKATAAGGAATVAEAGGAIKSHHGGEAMMRPDALIIPQDTADLASQEITNILAGKPPSTLASSEFGEFAPYVAVLREAYSHGGTKKARKIWDDLVQHEPAIAALVGAGYDPWHPITLADCLEMPQPRTYLVSPFIPEKSITIVYGAPGSLKSMLIADMAVSVALGEPWLPGPEGREGLNFPTTQAPVMWIDLDNGEFVSRIRFGALARARGLTENDAASLPLTIYSLPIPHLDLTDVTHITQLIQRIEQRHTRLLVIDPIGNALGEADENSPAIGQVFDHLRMIAEHTGAAILCIHHQRKATGYKSRKGESLRGHSAIEAHLDLAMLVERDSETSPEVTCQPTKIRGIPVPTFRAVFAYERFGDGHAGLENELKSARWFGLRMKVENPRAEIEAAIFEVLDETPDIKKSALVETVCQRMDKPRDLVRDVLDDLVATGKLKQEGTRHKGYTYRIP